MTVVNGVRLGAASPLLTRAGVKRYLGPNEAEIQTMVVEALVGVARKGRPRTLGDGLTGRHPELMLLNANNPNKGGRAGASAGIAKAMGLCPDYPDLQLPVMRGPFIGLWCELKVPGKYGTAAQRAMAEQLREEGHCVVECQTVQEAIDAFVGYLALEKNRPSVRPLHGAGPIDQQLAQWRAAATAMLTPKRR